MDISDSQHIQPTLPAAFGMAPLEPYQNVSWTRNRVERLTYVIAEFDSGTRHHRRVLGESSSIPAWVGRPLLYVDTYESGTDPEIFAYVRHCCSPSSFFPILNEFLESLTQKYAELRSRPFPTILAIGENASKGELPIPFIINTTLVKDATFFRLDLPFGAITVEFEEKPAVTGNELTTLLTGNKLTRRIESPLAGFDFSRGDVYKPLLLAVHWAADMVPSDVLEGIVGEITTPIFA